MMKSFATKGCVHGMTVQKQRGDMQTRILAYIEQEIKTRGYAPSVREIGEAVGLKSTSTVHGHLIRLEKKGLLHRDAMKPRAMGLSFSSLPPAENVMLREIPVIGRVAAGTPNSCRRKRGRDFDIARGHSRTRGCF